MGRSISQNVPDAEKLISMKSEELAGYLLEHLHSITENRRQRFQPDNLAAEISRGAYPTIYEERISDAIRKGYQWLKNRDYIFDRTANGFFDFTEKGEEIKTAEELSGLLRAEQVSKSSISTELIGDRRGAENPDATVTSTTPAVSDAPLLNNRYKILRPFPTSGFGQTFLAEDVFLPSKRKCVIKQFTFTSNSPDIYQLMLGRFEREAVNLENLAGSTEQIPDLYAHFSENGQFYLVQEWIEGETVANKVKVSGPLGENVVKDVLKDLLSILDHVHSRSIIHRDIKPENIILREGDNRPCLIDFGSVKEIARTIVDPFGNPSTTIVVGTPGFMPMEQAAGRPVFSSDIYSLGLTAIYMLTDKRPQELTDLRTGDIAWREAAKDVSAGFAAILDKAISPNFRERFATAREMWDALNTTTPDTLLTVKGEETTSEPTERKESLQPSQSVSFVPSPMLTSNMSQVATQWLRDFLSPIINVVGLIKKEFNQNHFEISAKPTALYSQIFIYRINFSKRDRWEELLSRDVGEYFLSYYPSIEKKLTSFGAITGNFDTSVNDLYKSIEESPVFIKQLVDTYERMIVGERIQRSQFENSTLPEMAKLILGQLRLKMSDDPEASKDNLVRFTAYSLLELRVEFPIHVLPDDHVLSNLCRDRSNELRGKDQGVTNALEEAKRLFEIVKSESASLWQHLRKERLEIARQYNATLE